MKKITMHTLTDGTVVFSVLGREYCTNREKEGLFKWDSTRGEYRQILGTCQFSLNQSTRSGQRAMIARRFADDLNYYELING